MHHFRSRTLRLALGAALLSAPLVGVTSTSATAAPGDPAGPTVVTGDDFTVSQVAGGYEVVVDLDEPTAKPRTIRIPGLGPLNAGDDLVLGADGNLYVALNVAGSVVRVDPDTGAQCTVAKGLPFVSSVRFGAGPGWDPDSLYTTSFAGVVTRLTP